MNKIQIITTQNIKLDFELAGVGERAIARIIDIVFQYSYLIVFIFFYNKLSSKNNLTLTLLLIGLIPFIFYYLIFEILMKGQTPGKKIRKLKIIKLDGAPLNYGEYFIRWTFDIIDQITFYMPAIISASITKNQQRIGDLVADSTVIKFHKRVSLDQTILRINKKDYIPYFEHVLNLSDKDINTIQEAIQHYHQTKDKELIIRLFEKVKSILGEGPQKLKPLVYLEKVINDYNYFALKK